LRYEITKNPKLTIDIKQHEDDHKDPKIPTAQQL